jgi:hypothetical protein
VHRVKYDLRLTQTDYRKAKSRLVTWVSIADEATSMRPRRVPPRSRVYWPFHLLGREDLGRILLHPWPRHVGCSPVPDLPPARANDPPTSFAAGRSAQPLNHSWRGQSGATSRKSGTSDLVIMVVSDPVRRALVRFTFSRIRCPHCEKVVSQMRAIVVATRNCPYCGRTVLEEPPCKA